MPLPVQGDRKCRRVSVGTLALLVVVSLSAGACNGPGGNDPAGGSGSGTPTSRAFGGRSLPVQAYFLTREQTRVVHRAMQRLVAPCMAAQGFDIGLPDMLEPPPGGHQPDFLDRRYDAVYDGATARKYGYHLPIQVDIPTIPPNDPRLTAEARAALYGAEAEQSGDGADVAAGRTSYGGCLGKAEEKLAAGMSYVSPGDAWSQPVRLLALDDTPQNDPQALAAQAKWSVCMAEKGYRITNTVADEHPEPNFDLSTPLPSKAEIAAALWDVHCQQRTKVVQIAFDVESQYERTKIDEQGQIFAQIRREKDLLVQRAATLLGEDVP